MQSGDGAAGEAEFAVVIIFDDGAFRILRPAQQRLPPGNGRHQPGGVLVVGRNVQRPGAGSGEYVRVNALTVQRNGNAGGAQRAVHLPDLGVSGILHGKDRVPAQQLRQQQIQVFRACADHDLLRRNGHAPEVPKVCGDGLPQSRESLMRNRREQRFRLLGENLTGELDPGGHGEPGGIHLIAAEIQPPQGKFRCGQRRGFADGRRRLLHSGDKKAPLGQRLQIALSLQLAVSALHRDDRDMEMLRQRPLGGQPCPGGKRAAENI